VNTLFLIVAYTLLGCILLSGAVVTAGLLIHVWRWARRTDTYEPLAAETPDLDAAFADARRIVTGRLCTADVEQLVDSYDWHAAEHMMRRTR
jgi:hypothetical protein